MNNLSQTHFPLKYETLPFLDITQLLPQAKQQSYRFLERGVSKPVVYRMSKNINTIYYEVYAVSRRPFVAEASVRSLVSPCKIYSAQSGTGAVFSPSTSVFSPASIILPMLHTHSYIYIYIQSSPVITS